ncbi:SDR family oxidoreductase [Sulfitobacter sp. AS59]|uniref:SDR family NAD(P)-dependent oxidoreductase n=1 Tax=Sulfitobacter sp. AS59 TaxID=3135784 RepID=UPI003181D181
MTRTVLVTGGAIGIGRAIADDLAQDHDVAIVWHRSPPQGLPDDTLAIQADLTKEGACADIVEKLIAHFGRLDVIVNNAGAVRSTPLDSFDAADQHALLAVNVLAPADLLAAALPHLQSGAAVVNISAVNAVLPPKGAALFGASKAALNLWTRAMAKELGPKGIRVNAVAPGAINIAENPRPAGLTELFVKETALGRIGTPQDIARAVRFLASDDASFVTGEVLTVSGGYRL